MVLSELGIATVLPLKSAYVAEKKEIKPGLWGWLRGRESTLEVVVEETRGVEGGKPVTTSVTYKVSLADFNRVQVDEEVTKNPIFYNKV